MIMHPDERFHSQLQSADGLLGGSEAIESGMKEFRALNRFLRKEELAKI